MSLPEQVHATLTPSPMGPEKEVYVASLSEMPGIVCSADSPVKAMDKLRLVVADIQRREGKPEVEVLDPPYIELTWQFYQGGERTHTIVEPERREAVTV